MNYQNVRVFQAILEHESISGAAKALHYTRSTVSEALKQLEEELGVQLILRERGVRKVMLTPAGRAFVPLVNEWAEMDQSFREFAHIQKKRVLRLSASTNSHAYIVPHLIRRLNKECPELELHLLSLSDYPAIRDAIKKRRFDIHILHGKAIEVPLAANIPLYDESRSILCPANTVLPDRVLTPEDLDPEFEVAYTKTPFMSSASRDWMQKTFPDRKPCMRVPEWMAIQNYLTDPRCWALMPTGIALHLLAHRPNELTIRQLTPEPPPRPCTLLVSRSYADTEALQCFLRCCAEYTDERPYLKRTLIL